MEIKISLADPSDTEGWLRLRAALWPDCPADRHRLEIRQLLASKGIVALARKGTEIIGMAEVSIRHDHVEGTSISPVPYLEGWFVSEQHRRQGIGRKLIAFVENWAHQNAYCELASDAELVNIESIRLHGSLGFREVGRTVHFVKNLASRTAQEPPRP